jgi:hypothetical protein
LIRAGEQSQVVDDSILEKAHTDQNAMITIRLDPSEGRFVKGLNFVSLFYQLSQRYSPIAAILIEKTVLEWDAKSVKYKSKS